MNNSLLHKEVFFVSLLDFSNMSSSEVMNWQILKYLVDKDYGIPIKFNNSTIIVPLQDALIKYDISGNKWEEIFTYPEEFHLHRSSVTCKIFEPIFVTAHDNEDLFIYKRHKLYKFNIKTKKFKKLIQFNKEYQSSVFTNEYDLHLFNVIAGTIHHTIFNIKINNFTEINTSNIKINTSYLGSVYLKTKQMILLIDFKKIFLFNIKLNKWNNLDIKYPTNYKLNIGQFGYILSRNEQYLILFTDDNIWIINLLTMNVRKSNIICPLQNGQYHD